MGSLLCKLTRSAEAWPGGCLKQNLLDNQDKPPPNKPTTVMMSPVNHGTITWGGITRAFSAFRRPALSFKCRTPQPSCATYITLHCTASKAARANCSSAAQTQSPAATSPPRHLKPHTQDPLRAQRWQLLSQQAVLLMHPVLTWQPSARATCRDHYQETPRWCVITTQRHSQACVELKPQQG